MTFFSNLFVTLNSTVNIFIYCAFGANFRKQLKLLCRKVLGQNRPNSRNFSSFSRHGTATILLRREIGTVSNKVELNMANQGETCLEKSPQSCILTSRL